MFSQAYEGRVLYSKRTFGVGITAVGCLIITACGELGQGSVGAPSRPGIEPNSINEDVVQGRPSCSVDPDPVFIGSAYVISVAGMPRATTVRLTIDDAFGSRTVDLQSNNDGRCATTETAGDAGIGQVLVSALRNNGFRDMATCTYTVTSPPICGDGSCDANEDCSSCEGDCGACPTCGDGMCDVGEDCSSCEADCGACEPACGNGTCEAGEDCSNCESDCGSCGPVCGDGTCETGEDCSSCEDDCGPCGPVCGDGICEGGEDCGSCSADCGACVSCGDAACQPNEDCNSCPADCGACEGCGDGVCDPSESCLACAVDCGVCLDVCGDSACSGGEDCMACPADCGACSNDMILTATAQPGSVLLGWTKSQTQRLRGYHVYRADWSGGAYGHIATHTSDVTAHADTSAPVGSLAYYLVKSFDNHGEETAVSNEASAAAEPPPPEPPVAAAGADWTAVDWDGDGLEEVFLDGSASTDPDGQIVSYEWAVDGSVFSTLSTATHVLAVGAHIVTLAVTDDTGLTDTDDLTVQILAQPIDPGDGAEALHGYWVWARVITDGVVTLEITEADLVWKVGPDGWEGCPSGISCLHYGNRMVAFDDLSDRLHYVKRVTTGSDYQMAGTYAVNADLVTATLEDKFSCAHPGGDAPASGVQYSTYWRMGDELWLSVASTGGVPPFHSAPPTTEPNDWIVFRQITQTDFHNKYSIRYCGAARDGVDSCHPACYSTDVLGLYR